MKQRSGEQACPFNYLYWDFLLRNQSKLKSVRRLAMPYRALARMSAERREQIRTDAIRFLDGLEPARPGWARAEA